MTTFENAQMKGKTVITVLASIFAYVGRSVASLWVKINSILLDVIGVAFLVAAAWYWHPIAGMIVTGLALLVLNVVIKR